MSDRIKVTLETRELEGAIKRCVELERHGVPHHTFSTSRNVKTLIDAGKIRDQALKVLKDKYTMVGVNGDKISVCEGMVISESRYIGQWEKDLAIDPRQIVQHKEARETGQIVLYYWKYTGKTEGYRGEPEVGPLWSRLGKVDKDGYQVTDDNAYNQAIQDFLDETLTVKLFPIPMEDIEIASRKNPRPIPGSAIWLPMITIKEDEEDEEDEVKPAPAKKNAQ